MLTSTETPRNADLSAERRSTAKAVASFASKVAKVQGARPFPQAAQALIRITSEPNFRLDDVVLVIESDPALTSQTLSQVNSATYARRVRCASVRQAVTLLGSHALRGIATATGVFSMFDNLSTDAAAEVVEHGKLVGAIARRLAPFAGLSPDEMYTCGLLHDVGKLMLLNADRRDYPALLKRHRGFEALHPHEREAYGFDHAVLAGHVLTAWRIPAPIPRVVGWHHRPDRAFAAGGSFSRRVALLRLADRASYLLDAKRADADSLADALENDEARKLLGLPRYALENVRDWLQREGFDDRSGSANEAPPATSARPSAPSAAPSIASAAAPAASAPPPAASAPPPASERQPLAELEAQAPRSEAKLVPPPLPPSEQRLPVAAAKPSERERALFEDSEPPPAEDEDAGIAPYQRVSEFAESVPPSDRLASLSESLPPSQRRSSVAASKPPAAWSESPAARSTSPEPGLGEVEGEADLEAWFQSEPTPEDGIGGSGSPTDEHLTSGAHAIADVEPAPAPASEASAKAPEIALDPNACALCPQKASGQTCPRCKVALCKTHLPASKKKYCSRCEGAYAAHRSLYPFEPLAVCLSASLFLLIGLGIGLWARLQHGPRWERVLGVALPIVLAELALLFALLGARRAQRAHFFAAANTPPPKG